ncbi:hypothetical protein TrLO_g15581 [Triparma laevis f. longispina]|uniref:Uncharacterized protein n=1 Tax=Triparma laevis f. longispina TaxID=1714387 RepID=A0A9W7KSN6_9STRA|nr:hypothetical protein TrLO_g15581 [Triparma laevis f. longispina]
MAPRILAPLKLASSDLPIDPVGTLLRHGPLPFIQRTINEETYLAAVDKYMLREGCSVLEAQANMDFYLRDPNTWASDKVREKKGGKIRDYARLDQKQVLLTCLWAGEMNEATS